MKSAIREGLRFCFYLPICRLLSVVLNPKCRPCIYAGMSTSAEFNLNETIALLERVPASVDALLRGLPDLWIRGDEGKDTWNPYDIVGHLIFGEQTDWMPRARMILEHGEARPFEPFDRLAQMKGNKREPLEKLLDDFARLRQESLSALRALNLQPEDLGRRGRHPALGVVTLAELLAAWAVHDLTHLHQLSRVMAHQYRGEVGPWNKYLGVLQCNGHSE